MADIAVTGALRERARLSLPLGLGLLVYCAGLLTPQARLADPDVMLHIVAGRWIIANRAVPRVDFLSHTVAGTPWVAHEWLGEVITAVLYNLLGWRGLVAMASLGLGAAVAIFARALARNYTPAQTIVIAAAAWFVTTPHWLARPHIIALPLLVAWMALLVQARQENRAPPPQAALLMIAWVNLHGTFLVGIGFAGLFTVEAVLLARGEAARVAAAKQWTAFSLCAILATLVTPYGVEAYLLPLHLLDMKFALSVLVEWKSVDFQKISTLEIWLLVFLGVALYRGIRLQGSRVFMVLLLFAMSLQHARNAELLAFIVPLLAAPDAGPRLRRAGIGATRTADWLDRLAWPATAGGLAVAGAIVAAAAGATIALPLVPQNPFIPAAALRAVVAAGITGPVLNDYDYGDYLMFAGVKTFIDGRADMYGDAFIKRYYRATRGLSTALPALISQYHIAWTIFPTGSPAVIELDRMAGWHRLYADAVAVVHVRDGGS